MINDIRKTDPEEILNQWALLLGYANIIRRNKKISQLHPEGRFLHLPLPNPDEILPNDIIQWPKKEEK